MSKREFVVGDVYRWRVERPDREKLFRVLGLELGGGAVSGDTSYQSWVVEYTSGSCKALLHSNFIEVDEAEWLIEPAELWEWEYDCLTV